MTKYIKLTTVIVVIISMFSLFRCNSSNSAVFSVVYPEFNLTRSTLLVGDTITMVNNSKGTDNTYSWTFEDGTPAESTEENPKVIFNSVGVKKITLKATGKGISQNVSKEVTVNNDVDISVSPAFLDLETGGQGEFTVQYAGTKKDLKFFFYEKLDENGIRQLVCPGEKDSNGNCTNEFVSPNVRYEPVYNVSDMTSEDRIYLQRNKYTFTAGTIRTGALNKGVINFDKDQVIINKYNKSSDTVFVIQRTNVDNRYCERQAGEEIVNGYYLNNNIFNTSGLNSGETSKLVFCSYVLKKSETSKVVIWRWDINTTQRSVVGFPNLLYGIGSDNTALDKTRVTVSTFPKLISMKDTPTAGAISSFKIKYNFETHGNKDDITRLFIDIYLNNIEGVTSSMPAKDQIKLDNKTIIRYVLVNKSELNPGTEKGVDVQIDNISYDIFEEKQLDEIEDGILPKGTNQSKVKRIIALKFKDAKRTASIESTDQELDVLNLIRGLINNRQFGEEMFNALAPTNNPSGNIKYDFHIQSVRMGIQPITGSGIIAINKFEVIIQ